MVTFFVKDKPSFEALDEGVHQTVSLVQPHLVVEFVNFDVTNTVTSVVLLDKGCAMEFVLLPKLIILISMKVS